jgi:glutathione S-transferase
VVGDSVTVGDFVLAYTLDWAHMESLLEEYPALRAYVDRMYARPRAAMRITEAAASVGLS